MTHRLSDGLGTGSVPWDFRGHESAVYSSAPVIDQPVDYGAGYSHTPFDSGMAGSSHDTSCGPGSMKHGSDPNANVDLSTYGHSHAAW